MKLGSIIQQLEGCDPEAPVRFDFGGLSPDPTQLDSYRGYYNDLALGWTDRSCTVQELLEALREANGRTFTGYKGGEFDMNNQTPVWIAEYGRTSDTKIIGIEEDYYVTLHTGLRP
tara:strand:+ start:430 stop:777 length:348 start_codon:yes stop_codon:yes gene_type:complete